MALAKASFLCLCLLFCVTNVSSMGASTFPGGTSSQFRNSSIAAEFEERIQNLTSRLLSGFDSNILNQLQQYLSDRGIQNFTGETALQQIIQNATSNLITQVTSRTQNELKRYIVETINQVINNTFPPILAEILLSPEFNKFVTDFLTSPEVTNLVDGLFSGSFTDESNDNINGIITSLFGPSDNQTSTVVILLQALQNSVRENRPELVQVIIRALSDNSSIGNVLQQLFANQGNGNNPVTEDELASALSRLGLGDGVAIESDFMELLANTSALGTALEQILAGWSTVNLTKLLAGLNVTEILENLFSSNLSTSLNNLVNMLQNTSALRTVLVQVLAGGTSGNLTDVLTDMNLTEFLENLSNLSTTLSTPVGLFQNSTVVQETLTVVSTLVKTYVGTTLKDNRVSYTCQDSLKQLIEGLISQQQWALQMIDANFKLSSNLLGSVGQWKLLGSYDECVDITATGTKDDVSVEYFNGKYCRLSFKIPGIPDILGGYPLVLGSCVPSACKAPDINGMVRAVETVTNITLPFIMETKCEEERQLETDAVIVLCILVVLGMLMVIGTLYDVLVVQLGIGEVKHNDPHFSEGVVNQSYVITDGNTTEKLKQMKEERNISAEHTKISMDMVNKRKAEHTTTDDDFPAVYKSISNADTETHGVETSGTSNSDNIETPKLISVSEKQRNPGETTLAGAVSSGSSLFTAVLEQIFLSFSVYTNGVKILGTDQGPGALGAINGIRFLSMAWVILGHTYFFALGYSKNLISHFSTKMSHWTFMSIGYASVAVDSFFALSGLLVAYLTLKELNKVKGPRNFNWLLYYFHRFWRLTPPYMLVLMVGTVLLPYVATGPMWSYDEDLPFMASCRKTWWTNLLYVNNLVKADSLCMGWSWYLANDMQFYVISPLILLPLFYHAAAGIGTCLIFLAGTVTAAGVITYKHEYPVQGLLPYAPTPKDADESTNLYIPCYTRMGPYIIGLFTGYLLYRWQRKCRIPKVVNLILWLLSIGICCAVVYGPYSYEDNHIFTVQQSAAFNALHRTGWGVAICWMVFSCACGHGGWISQILSWKAFVPLGRLTYCAYLIHPLVMSVFLNSRRQLTYFSDYEVAYMFLGHLVASYGAAFIVSLAFESPMMGLEKTFIKKGK